MNRFATISVALAGAAVVALGVSTTSSGTTLLHRPAAAPVQQQLAATPQTAPETHYVSLTPCRIVDTREAGGAIASNGFRNFVVGGTTMFLAQGGRSGGCGVPTTATAVSATVAVLKPASPASGFVKAYPTTAAEPGAVVLNYGSAAGATSTGATVPVAPGGGYELRVRNAGVTAQLIVDVSGYYVPQIQALINGDGTISSGSARVLSVAKGGTGAYLVTLDRPARQCAPSAVTFNLSRYASVGLSSTNTPNVISVYVWALNSTAQSVPTDYSFFLTVSC